MDLSSIKRTYVGHGFTPVAKLVCGPARFLGQSANRRLAFNHRNLLQLPSGESLQAKSTPTKQLRTAAVRRLSSNPGMNLMSPSKLWRFPVSGFGNRSFPDAQGNSATACFKDCQRHHILCSFASADALRQLKLRQCAESMETFRQAVTPLEQLNDSILCRIGNRNRKKQRLKKANNFFG